jgi:hypothetical protein
MFITDNKPLPEFVDSENSFIVKELLWVTEEQSDECLYRQIVFKVLRNPETLTFHLQRIYLTYRMGVGDQLYAALADLLYILDGKGKALSSRMIASTKSLLSEEQANKLGDCLEKQNSHLLATNKYSVCIKGVIGTRELVFKSHHVKPDHDPLELARDYIHYSQLDEALKTLETACLKYPEREDLQKELLGLLKLTKNIQAFTELQNIFLENKLKLSGGWQELAEYFAEMGNEK